MAGFSPLPAAEGCGLVSATPGPDLPAARYVEREYSVRGEARAFEAGPSGTPEHPDSIDVVAVAEFNTRVVVRRPTDDGQFSGNVVVEWLNVSSGADAAPGYTYVGHELVRNGDVWVGVSAQYVGVAGGTGSVGAPGAPSSSGLMGQPRYADLVHPGDAFCYDIFSQVAAALGSPGGPLGDVDIECIVAIGESQSAMALTTYVNCVSPHENIFDGFLIHSRAGAGLPLRTQPLAVDLLSVFREPPAQIRHDLDVPVLTVQTETDILGDFGYFFARQPDGPRFRLWEIAGSAHADRYQVGDFEEFLGCAGPVNRGQQRFVLRAAVRALTLWARGGDGPPIADRLLTHEDTDGELSFSTDDFGNVLGGVRTPSVDAPVFVLSGIGRSGESRICRLFGSTEPADSAKLERRYRDSADYLDQYAAAGDAAIAAGFVLSTDRDELLSDADPSVL